MSTVSDLVCFVFAIRSSLLVYLLKTRMKTAYLSINDKISKILVSSKFRILDLQYTDEGYFETFGKRIEMKYILLSFLDTKLFHGAKLRQYPFGKFT